MAHWLLVIFCIACSAHAAGGGHTSNPRQLIHAFPPGGPLEVAGTPVAGKTLRTLQRYAVPAFTDILAAHVAQTLQGISSEPLEVTRRARHAGAEAATFVGVAAPDGRTLLLTSGLPAPSPTGSTARPDPRLTPIAHVASMPYVLIASKASQTTNLDYFMQPSRPPLFVGTAGERTAAHAGIELLRTQRGLQLRAVSYNGGIAALHAVATQQIRVALIPLPAVVPYLGAGRVRVITIAEARRHPAIPNVLTSTEWGLAGFEATGWFTLFAPSGTAQPIVRTLDMALERGLASDHAQQLFFELGLRLEHQTAHPFYQPVARAHSS